jgi:hypothetical protein
VQSGSIVGSALATHGSVSSLPATLLAEKLSDAAVARHMARNPGERLDFRLIFRPASAGTKSAIINIC